MPRPFNGLLAHLIKLAAPPSDIAHLRRWLESGEADEIWSKISGSAFHSGDAFAFVKLVLTLRRTAKKADKINKEIPALERKKKRYVPKKHRQALKSQADNEITPEQYDALKQRIEKAALRSKFFDPLLSNRSDEKGTRQRTIFCRMLSDTLHDTCGKWHDPEVEALCNIAFGGRNHVTTDVRAARRKLRKR